MSKNINWNKFNTLFESANLLQDSSNQIEEGAKKLAEGTSQLKDGSLSLSNGIEVAYSGSKTIKAEIEKCSGTQFDPEIAKVFLDLLENHYDEIEKIQNSYY